MYVAYSGCASYRPLDATPFRGPAPNERLRFMTLVGYYDGSGNTGDKNCKVLTLGGFCGEAKAWETFEDMWLKCLRDHGAPEKDGVPYFHTKDAVALRRGFSKHKGWNDARVNTLVNGLFRVFGKAQPMLKGAVFPVLIKDFEKAAAEFTFPHLDSVEALCVDGCLTNTVHPNLSEAASSDIVKLYFDRTEKFMHKVRRVFEKAKRSQRTNKGWVRQTALIAPLDMHKTPGLQAADLAGWTTNRHYTGTQEGQYEYWYQWLSFINVAKHNDVFRYEIIKSRLRESQ
jgi:hypothetical protein